MRLVRRQRFSVVFDKFIVTKNKFFIPSDENQDTSTVTEMRLPEDEYPAPTLKPTQNEYPRLMFRQQDISKIKSNMDEEQNKASYDMWQNFLNSELDGKLPQPKSGGTNYSSSVINRIEAYALDYALNKNEQRGRKAIEAVNDYANTVVFDGDSLNYRKRGQIIFTFAEVYDWCYDILTEDERKHIISQCEVIATELDMGYPPRGQGAVCGHGGEPNLLRDLLAFGIATYDERPDIYNFVAGRILSEFTETRNYWYAANNHHQGNSYGAYRGNCEAWSNYLFYAMSGVTPFSDEQEYFAYEWLYARRPDGQSFRDGDDYHEESGAGNYWKGWYSTLFALTSVYDNDYEKRELLREDTNLASYSNQYSMMTASQVLIMNNPHNDGKPVSQLSLTKYFASPQGMMIARTGWNDGVKAPDVVALIENDDIAGAVISDRVAVFAKNKERISKSLTFDIPAEGRYKVFAGGLRDGTWKTQDGTTFIVTKDGAAGYFESSGGAVTLTYVSPNNRREEIVGVIDESDDIGIRINNAFLYSDVKPVLEDGRTLLPMRAIFEALGAQVSWNEESKTAEAKIGEVTIRLTENSKTAYVNGGATELDVPTKILDGRFVVPVRFVAEASGAKVEWDRFARIVDITVSKSGASKPGVFRDGIAKIIGCTSNSVGDNDRGENSYDGDLTTVWATNGIGEAIVYEFDKEYTIESVFLRLNKATERIAYFDLEYSNDGVNFTKIGSYAANGTTETEVFTLPSSVNAKYIKYIAKGNNTSEWHAIYEIEVNVKK